MLVIASSHRIAAAFPANTNTTAVRGSDLRLFGMDTYTCNETGPRAFDGFVQRGIGALGPSNYGAALSSVNTSVVPVQKCISGFIDLPPLEELRKRFKFMVSQGVNAIALLQGSPDPANLTGMYMPLMREFLAGGTFDE